MPYDKVIICSGHMIDAPDRKTPRFPPAKAEAVREKIAQQLEQWRVSDHDLAICSGASGADILFAEQALRRGAQLRLLLAQGMDDFVRDSVQKAGEDWVRRFHVLAEQAQVETLPPPSDETSGELSIYARTNLWIINTARTETGDTSKLYALLVWDEQPTGDGPGGTSDFAARLQELGAHMAVIDPTTIG